MTWVSASPKHGMPAFSRVRRNLSISRRYIATNFSRHLRILVIVIARLPLWIGIRLARAQDVLLDWFKRKDTVIERYNDIEERIIRRFADRLKRKREIIHEYAQLLALRGSLKREIGMYRGSSLDLNKSIELAQKLGDHLLQVDVICELAHLWLAIGK